MSETVIYPVEKYLMIKEVINYMNKDDAFDTMPLYFFDIKEEDRELSKNIAKTLLILFNYYDNMSLDCNEETFMNFWCLYGYACGNSCGWTKESFEHYLNWLIQQGAINIDWRIRELSINNDFLEDLLQFYEVSEYSIEPLLEEENIADDENESDRQVCSHI